MSIAAAIKTMRERGLSAEDILAVVEALVEAEGDGRSSAAVRQSRYRERLGMPGREWRALRAAVIRRDGMKCAYCGALKGRMSIDHVTPLSRGGSNAIDNLTVACIPCNSGKADRLLSEWRR